VLKIQKLPEQAQEQVQISIIRATNRKKYKKWGALCFFSGHLRAKKLAKFINKSPIFVLSSFFFTHANTIRTSNPNAT
jgi:hypothetical protein